MRSASYQLPSDPWGDQPRSRAVSLFITIALHILALILLLRFVPQPPDRIPRPVSLQLMPDARENATSNPRTHTVTQVKHASGGAARRGPEPPATPKAQPPAAPPTTAQPSLSLLPIDLASSDISKMPSHPGDRDTSGGASDADGAGKSSGSVYGPSDGPNGERLYDADWYTRPTNAQLQTYVPAAAPSTGWGLIACKPAPRYQVEDCHILGESPGSGYGRAVLNAAWQFRVLPPRVGGHTLTDVWIKIRIDYLEGNASAR